MEVNDKPSTSEPKIRIKNVSFNAKQHEMSDCDSDDQEASSQTSAAPNALTEPYCDGELTDFEAQVLRADDTNNDKALREIVQKDCYDFKWTMSKDFTGQREKFTATKGANSMVIETVVDIFYKMFDINFIDKLCKDTNQCAEQKIAFLKANYKPPATSQLNHWIPPNRDEMVSFLALMILQGLYPVETEEKHFCFNGFGTMPYFSRIMSYNRYMQLNSFYQYIDNEETEKTYLSKINPFIDYLNKKFSMLYYPWQELVINESRLNSHGKLSFSQNIKTKAEDRLKIYELCDASTGYTWKIFVDFGKNKPKKTVNSGNETDQLANDGTNTIHSTDVSPSNAPIKIVFGLVEQLLNNGHTLILDNFYTCPLLVRHLKQLKTDCYGTMRLNREFVPDYMKQLNINDIRVGEISASCCSDLSIMAWRGDKLICMISSYHTFDIKAVKTRKKFAYKPNIISDYDKAMEGVYKKDKFLSTQPLDQVGNKMGYRKLFRRLYNVALFNCSVIYNRHKNMTHEKFRITLAEALLRQHRNIDLTSDTRMFQLQSPRQAQSPLNFYNKFRRILPKEKVG